MTAISARRKRLYFSWCCAYWSCTHEQWDALQEIVSKHRPFDLQELGIRELSTRPRGHCEVFRDVFVPGK